MKNFKIFAAIAAILVANSNVFAQYTIYGAKTGKYDAVIVTDTDSTTYTYMAGKPGDAFHKNRAFSVGASAAYESQDGFRVGAEVAYMWNWLTETSLSGSYGIDSKKWEGTLTQRFYTKPSNFHNWTWFVGLGVRGEGNPYSYDASDEIKKEALSMGFDIHDNNNYQFIVSPMLEFGAKRRITKNFAIQFSVYGGYECNKAPESLIIKYKKNGEVFQKLIPTTAKNRGFFGGAKISLRFAFQKGKEVPKISY